MRNLIFNRDEELAIWAEAEYPKCAPLARPFTAIGITDEKNNILGVAFYNFFRYHDINITFVSSTPRWATPGIIRAILHYPFIQLGVERMTAVTSKSNKKARKALEQFGAKLEGVHPKGFDGIQASCSYGLTKDIAMKKWFGVK